MAISPEDFVRLRKRFRAKMDDMDTEWRTHWQQLARYFSPRHGRFLERTDAQAGRGGNRHQYIINGTATDAASIAAAGIRGGLTPHSLPWFKLSLWDEDLAEWPQAKEWLAEVSRRMSGVFSRSNFYSAVSQIFYEQLLFGTCPLQAFEDDRYHAWFRPWTIGEYVLATDAYGRVDTGFRWFWTSVQAAADWFGKSRLQESTQTLLQNQPDKHIQIVCAIYPRKHYDPRKRDSTNLPWGAVYWEYSAPQESPPLRESGFASQSVLFPRWEVVGEDAYGSNCPGMKLLGDTMMLQNLERDKLEALEKIVKPPVNAPTELIGRLSLLPNATNYVSGTSAAEQLKPTYQISPDLNHVRQEIRDVEIRIQKGFYNDLFLMILNDKKMTATEVAQRHEDKLAILGPVIERQNSELLSPLIDRMYDLMERSGMIPPAPQEMRGQEIRVEYISLLAQAQKMVGSGSLEKTAAFVGNLAELRPDVTDNVDWDEMVEQYADLQGTPPRIIRTRENVKKLRDMRAQAEQQQQALMQADQAAQAARNLSSAKVEEDNVLGMMREL